MAAEVAIYTSGEGPVEGVAAEEGLFRTYCFLRLGRLDAYVARCPVSVPNLQGGGTRPLHSLRLIRRIDSKKKRKRVFVDEKYRWTMANKTTLVLWSDYISH